MRTRRTLLVGLAVAGIASLLTWGGLVVAPAVLLVAAVVPARLTDRLADVGT